MSMILAMALTFLFRNFEFSRLFFMCAWVVALMFFWVERGLLRWIRRGMYLSGAGRRRLMIWGCDEVAKSLLELYARDPWRGKNPVALIDGWTACAEGGDLPMLTPDQGREWIEQGRADEVIVTRHDLPREELYRLAQACRTQEIALKLVPDLMEVVAGQLSVEGVEGFPMVEMGNNLGRYYPQLVKRIFDIVIGGLITLILLPILGIIALFVKWGSPGPVLFEHWRLGKGRRKFPQYKFRTMVHNAGQLLAEDPELRAQFQEGFKLKDDPRVTKVGRFLRKWSLDELPQLFNVLRGEMSLVGPRPIVENETEKYGVFADALFSVTPGMTGLWQVSGRSDVGYEERVKLDLLYIERWTLLEDLRILLLTPGAVISGRGSY
jgi:exopolysaccharide biosynthesis polyprenyl glycosylphosphotransferase